MTETIARQLAGFIRTCRIQTLPQSVTGRAKLYTLDTLGAIAAGVGEPSSRIITSVASRVGGRGNCTVIGSDLRVSATTAALINGAAGHAVEIDDDHRTSALHPGVAVLPAALAVAEDCGADGSTLLEGIVAGYEVMTRIGDAFRGGQDRVGFHSTGTCGVFGAAAAAGRILQLDTDQLSTALGIAGSQAAGLQAWKSDGSWTKRLHPGKAAESGILSALLAAEGYTGPETIFEGPHGFLKAYAGGEPYDPDLITRNLGTEFRGAETAFKPYACCRFSHQLVDVVLNLVAKHEFDAKDVERCVIRIYRSGYNALFEPAARRARPETVVDAQFTAPYIVAVSLIYGPPLPHHFNSEMLSNPAVLELIGRIEGAPDDTFEKSFPDSYPTHVTILLKDGRRIEGFEEVASGDPAKQVYSKYPERFEEEIVQKFRSLMNASPHFRGRVDAILRDALRLESLEAVTELSGHLAATDDSKA